ncbi:hypothetical protein [Pseudarthrobacter sp. Y6]|uniref:hypothetical protein n=1 Tax=Pseudarthrobacter sp. Y6 TaxID=3418422 RepID=UPI003CF14227
MTRRPKLSARPYVWKSKDGSGTPGVGLFQGGAVKAHLTPNEARTLADRIHDLTDAAGNPEPALETLPHPESE